MTKVVVKSRGQKYTQEISAGRHLFTGDEPVDNGGEDLGPTPYQLLLSSLGTCTSITLQMYARRKDWPLEAVEVSVQGQRPRGAKAGEPEYNIGVTINLEGPLTPEQRDRLLEIAGRCPVKRTLTGRIQIDCCLEPGAGQPTSLSLEP
jgi:putative redox protein